MFWVFWVAAIVLFWLGTVHDGFSAAVAAALTLVPTAILLRLQYGRR